MTTLHRPKPMPNIVLDFGRYRGRAVASVAAQDPGYLLWVATLPKVRGNPALWASVRGYLLQQLQAEIDAEMNGDLA